MSDETALSYLKAAEGQQRRWSAGRRVVALSGGDPAWLELLLLDPVAPGAWSVVAPDGAVTIKELVAGYGALEKVLLVPESGGRPGNCRGEIRRFTEVPTEAQRRAWKKESRKLADSLRAARRGVLAEHARGRADAAPAKPVSPETDRPGDDAGVEDEAGDGVWIYAEPGPRNSVGDEVREMTGASVVGDRALLDVGVRPLLLERVRREDLPAWKGSGAGKGSDKQAPVLPEPAPSDGGRTPRHLDDYGGGAGDTDARVLPVLYNRSGQRRREWREVVEDLHEVTFDSWPVAGPRTSNWVAAFFRRRGVGPEDHHRWWRTVCRLSAVDWGVGEHSQCCRYLEVAGCFDQLDLGNVAVIELVARRIQTIEFQYRERVKEHHLGAGGGGAPAVTGSAAMSIEEAELFDGADRVHATLCCSPELVKHVTAQMRDQAELQRHARQAREEQAAWRDSVQPGQRALQGPGAAGGGAAAGPAGPSDETPDAVGAKGRGRRRGGRTGA